MWYNSTKLALIGCALVLLGVLIGGLAGVAFTERAWRNDAVQQGFGHYSAHDGAWYWSQDVRPALHDQRGWVLCPLCCGMGEMYLGEPTLVPAEPPQPEDPTKKYPWLNPDKPGQEM